MRRFVSPVIGLVGLALTALPCSAVQQLTGGDADYDALLAMIGKARIVMLGEATHGSPVGTGAADRCPYPQHGE